MKTTVKASTLQIGDIVRIAAGVDEGYSDCTVYQIEKRRSGLGVLQREMTIVHLVRPYVHTADFLCTAGVITYIGQENFQVYDETEVYLMRRAHPEETREKIKAIVSDIRTAIESNDRPRALELLRNL